MGLCMQNDLLSLPMFKQLAVLFHQWNVASLLQKIQAAGGNVYLVGGAVRDIMLGLPFQEVDIEVHNLSLNDLTKLLQERGQVNLVGKVFGVLKIEHIPIDWSLPRSDESGRKPKVTLDPAMNIIQALRRRDLTMNAMAIDLQDNVLIDPFNGLKDIACKRLSAPDLTLFVEDPLRIYRVMQFVSRFAMQPDHALDEVCKTIDVSTVSRERIEEEMRKLMLKSKQPSLGLRWLAHINRLHDLFPELAMMCGVVQDPVFHPEGDVFEHAMQALDAAAELVYADNDQKLIVMYAALCHDIGKATTTQYKDGRIRSIGHEKQSARFAGQLLKKIIGKKDYITAIIALVSYHMAPMTFVTQGSSAAAYKRLAVKLAPYDNLALLSMLALADKRGRNPHKKVPLQDENADIVTFRERASAAGVLMHPEEPVLKGSDLIDSISPGPLVGKLVARAYALQINKGITDKQVLKKRVLS